MKSARKSAGRRFRPSMDVLEGRVLLSVLYGAEGGVISESDLFTLNTTTGARDQTIGAIGFAVTGLAFDQQTGILYGVTSEDPLSPPTPFNFITIDTQTGAGTLVTTYTEFISDITYDPTTGNIYGWQQGISIGDDRLVLIDKTTGAATPVGITPGVDTFQAGLASDAAGNLFLTGFGADGALASVNKTTGAVTPIANMTGAPIPAGDIPALSFQPGAGALWGVNSNIAFSDSNLVTINTTSGVVSNVAASMGSLDAIAWDYSSNLTGVVFNDLSGNGVQDPSDPGLGNVTVNLDLNNDGVIDLTTLSDSSGFYSFNNVQSGTHSISVTVPSGQSQTFPADNGSYQINMTGVDQFGFNFGLANGTPLVQSSLLGVGAGPGQDPRVRVFDLANNNAILKDFIAYDPAFKGGVNVALGDVNGDSVQDVITAPASNGGSDVRVWDGVTGQLTAFFLAYPGFNGGVNVAVGDVDGDGVGDIITGPANGGGTHVRVFQGGTFTPIRDFLAFDPNCRGGVSVAAGNVDGAGADDIVVGLGSPGSLVAVFNGQSLAIINTFYVFNPDTNGSVKVAVGNFNGDNFGDIYVAQGRQGSMARVFNASDATVLAEVNAYPGYNGGSSVATVDIDNDGLSELVTGPGPSGGPNVRVFDDTTLALIDNFLAFDFAGGGANVGG